MINKKAIFKSLIIISLLIIIIVAVIQVRNTLARYETTATTEKDVDVAFWIVDNSFKSERILIEDIYPSTNSFEYTFSVSNFDPGTLSSELDDNIAETDLEYEIVLTTTTNLPLNYELYRNGTRYLRVNHQNTDTLYTDTDGTYYRELKLGTEETPYPFLMDTIVAELDGNGQETGKNVKRKITDNFILKIEFPQEFSANSEYADLMEDIKIELSARQVIDE